MHCIAKIVQTAIKCSNCQPELIFANCAHSRSLLDTPAIILFCCSSSSQSPSQSSFEGNTTAEKVITHLAKIDHWMELYNIYMCAGVVCWSCTTTYMCAGHAAATENQAGWAKAGNSRSVHDTPAINSPHHHLVRRTKKSSSFLIFVTEIIESSGDTVGNWYNCSERALVLGIYVMADRDR